MYGVYRVSSAEGSAADRQTRRFKRCVQVLVVVGVIFVATVIVLLALAASKSDKRDSAEHLSTSEHLAGIKQDLRTSTSSISIQNDDRQSSVAKSDIADSWRSKYRTTKDRRRNQTTKSKVNKNTIDNLDGNTTPVYGGDLDAEKIIKGSVSENDRLLLNEKLLDANEDKLHSSSIKGSTAKVQDYVTEKSVEDLGGFIVLRKNGVNEKLGSYIGSTKLPFDKYLSSKEVIAGDLNPFSSPEPLTDNDFNEDLINLGSKQNGDDHTTASVLAIAKNPSIEKVKFVTIEKECPQVCESIGCKMAGAKIISKIDYSVDPCEDFYKYSCNGVIANEVKEQDRETRILKTIAKNLKSDRRNDQFLETYKTFHKSCMSFKCDGTTDPVLKHFMPIYNDIRDEDLTDLLVKVIQQNLHRSASRLLPVFDLQIEFIDDVKTVPVITVPFNSDIMQEAFMGDLYVIECKMLIHDLTESNVGTIYESYQKCLRNKETYIKLLEKSIKIFDLFGSMTDYEKEQKIKDTLLNVEWEILDNIPALNDQELGVGKNVLKFVSMDELAVLCPRVNWIDFFVQFKIQPSPEKVGIRFLEKFEKMCEFYKSDFKTIKTSIFAMLSHDWYVDFMMPTIIPDRERYCDKLASGLMQDAAANILTTNAGAGLESFEKLAQKLFEQIVQTLILNIETSAWMTNSEKGELISKLNILKLRTKYSKYNGLSAAQRITERSIALDEDDFVKNVVALRRRIKNLQTNPSFTDLSFDFISPLSQKIQTLENQNLIIIPLGMAIGAMKQSQDYQDIATIGLQLSHAIINFKNIFKSLKENEMLQNFLTVRFVDPAMLKISNGFGLEVSQTDLVYTNPSRFADDSAIRLAWDTYNTFYKLSNDQPLFGLNASIGSSFHLIAAQQFCGLASESKEEFAINFFENEDLDGHLRVNNMAMNSIHFAESFDCPIGSTMNPEFKSDQFPFIVDL